MRLAAALRRWKTVGGGVPNIGDPFGGGYLAGKIKVGSVNYYVIASGKSGETTAAIRDTSTGMSGNLSVWDGKSNTAAMVASGSATNFPAAYFCKNLTLGGYNDWYLPAKDELELLYRNLKPTTAANNTSGFGANSSSDPAGTNYTSGSPTRTTVSNFISGGADALSVAANYFTSSSAAPAGGSATDEWWQRMNDGAQSFSNITTSTYLIRAVRAVPV